MPPSPPGLLERPRSEDRRGSRPDRPPAPPGVRAARAAQQYDEQPANQPEKHLAGAGAARRPAPRPPVQDPMARQRFRRAVILMVMTLFLPGSAQIAAGDRRIGRAALRVVIGLVATVLGILLAGVVFGSFWYWLAANTVVLGVVRWGLVVLALGWAFLFVDAWRLGDPLGLRRKQRLAMVGINGVLCLSVAGSLLFCSHLVTAQKDLIATMFSHSAVTGAHEGRFNVLLLGGDSGATRWGLRPDSISVASIDADTGKTVLFGLPRNLQNFPFKPGSVMAKQFPKGYNCSTCEINSLVTWAADHKNLFKGYANPGVEATTEAVEGVTGLNINYYAMVNLQGFRDLVDAVGGVTLTVRDPIPKGAIGDFDGKSYIPKGRHKLNGADTLWYARSRMAADDYSRMARQKCVMSAMLHQLSPEKVVLNFGKIAAAGTSMVRTDIPGSELDRFMKLAVAAKKQPIRTVSFVPPAIKTYDPDIAKIHRSVSGAIQASEKGSDPGGGTKSATRPAAPKQGTTGGSYGNIRSGYAANSATDLAGAC